VNKYGTPLRKGRKKRYYSKKKYKAKKHYAKKKNHNKYYSLGAKQKTYVVYN
jgi:hypothetical protein